MTEEAEVWSESAENLSETERRFLSYMREDPERSRQMDHLALDYPDWLRNATGKYYPLQSWPTYIEDAKLREIERATVGVTHLIRAVPERIFGNDPRRYAEFHEVREVALVGLLLEPPTGIEGLVVRNDFIDSPRGLKVLEVNAGLMGGWQLRYFERSFFTNPVLARFHQEQGITPRHRDPIEVLLHHIILDNLGSTTCAGGVLNVGIAVPIRNAMDYGATLALTDIYTRLLAEHGRGLTGEVRLCSFEAMTAQRGTLYQNGWPVHAIVELYANRSEAVFRSFKAGKVSLYNGPIGPLLSDKRNLALLSQYEDSDAFSAEEREIIRNHIPWSRELTIEQTSFRGEVRRLEDILLTHREDLVLKPAAGYQGKDVRVGRFTSPEEWEATVREALGTKGWLVQEHVESRPYLYQLGEQGSAVHDVIWGLFCFGNLYGGAFLRMLPKGSGDGVINSARGATEGILLEV
jgi:hypothetical protein